MGTTQSAEQKREQERQAWMEGPIEGFSRLMASFAPLFAVWLSVYVHRMQYAWNERKHGDEDAYLLHDNLHIEAKQTLNPLTLLGMGLATYKVDRAGLLADVNKHRKGDGFGEIDPDKIYKKQAKTATQILYGMADENQAHTAVEANVLLGCRARRFAQIARAETWVLRPLLVFLVALTWYFTFMYDYARYDMPFSLRDEEDVVFNDLYGPDNWYFAHLINVIIFLVFGIAALFFHYQIRTAVCANAPDSAQRVAAFMQVWRSDECNNKRQGFQARHKPTRSWMDWFLGR